MDYNELTGSIPIMLSIEYLSLGVNFLSGTIPDSVTFENMYTFIADYNMISGRLPESLFTPTLELLSLGDNKLSGSLTNKISDLVELWHLGLMNNDLTGTIPSEIGALKNLEGLVIDANSFKGTIPSEIGLLPRVQGLWLSDNQLSGTVPIELSSLSALSIKLFANNLTGSLDMFCNKTTIFPKIIADCAGVDAAVECTCCTSCCDSMSGNCTVNVDATCLVQKSWFEVENGPSYYESGGTVCECTNGFDSKNDTTILSCMDTQCQSCNDNGTVCSVNEHYKYSYDELGYPRSFHSTFQYVVGRNDTVTIEYTVLPDFTKECEVTVNGQKCNNCVTNECEDQFAGVFVDCENVEEAGAIDLCSPKPEDTDGPLAVFAFQDSAFLQGCPPRLFN
jgi:hypothetical protein